MRIYAKILGDYTVLYSIGAFHSSWRKEKTGS